jgi:hypothetical protein
MLTTALFADILHSPVRSRACPSRLRSRDGRQRSRDAFTLLFSQVFGLEKTLLLTPQYPVEDIDSNICFIDYALHHG